MGIFFIYWVWKVSYDGYSFWGWIFFKYGIYENLRKGSKIVYFRFLVLSIKNDSKNGSK